MADEFLRLSIPLFLGYILDAIWGDPIYLPHPIRWFGNSIAFLEKQINQGSQLRVKGAIMALVLVISVFIIFYLFVFGASYSPYIYYPLSTIIVFYGLANRSLINEGRKVNYKLINGGIEAGRKQLSYIVGRDTSRLSPHKIRLAILETLSENLSDGVIAPLFYYAIGGLPAMFAYKMINTLDSMIGYKNERYLYFGRFAAKLDDVANYIPARMTAVLMLLVSGKWSGLGFVLKYGRQHSSPNAGFPESALAYILDCRFGGPNMYHGKMVDKPYIGSNDREIISKDIDNACSINWKSSVLFVLIIVIIFALMY